MIYPGPLLQERYRVDRLLGRTMNSETWQVDDNGTPKVLKVLQNNYPKVIELFQREAEVLKQLNHPGIPKVEADGYFTFQHEHSTEPLHCLVMQFIDGQNLKQWLEEQGNKPISQEQARDWLKQLVEILAQIHEQKYFHRDIKPSNIMRRPDGKLVLIDFGAVREITVTFIEKRKTQDITRVYSQGYTAPEQLSGEAIEQSDFFALGRTFVYLLTGKEPGEFQEDQNTFQLQLDWRSSAPPGTQLLADLIDRLMDPSPQKRPENAQEILQSLELLSLNLSLDPILSDLPGILKFGAKQILKYEYQRWVKQQRTPSIALYGRAGSGKSSLINAILEEPVADVSLARRGTLNSESYQYDRGGWKLNFVDSRGVGDAEGSAAFTGAIDYIVQKKVDVLLFVAPVDERNVHEDIKFLTALKATHKRKYQVELPVILVLNKIDRVDPEGWNPKEEYNLRNAQVTSSKPKTLKAAKEANIRECMKARIDEYSQLTDIYVPVCAKWNEWQDARYNIDALVLQIYNCIPDEAAKHSFGGATANIALKKAIANRLTSVAAWLVFFVVFLPTFNSNHLLLLQKILVRAISKIAENKQNQGRTVKELLKQLEVTPSGPQAALSQTLAIGEAAICYFIEEGSIQQVKQAFAQSEGLRYSELQEAESPQEIEGILRQIDAEISELYGIAPLYENQK